MMSDYSQKTVRLPQRLKSYSVIQLLEDLFWKDKIYDKYSIDFGMIEFVEPAGMVCLSNLIDFLRKKGSVVDLVNYNHTQKASVYLDDAGFFKTYLGKSIRSCGFRETMYSMNRIECEYNPRMKIDNDILPWLARQFGMKVEAVSALGTCIGEVFNNVLDHSGERIICFFAQHFPNKREIKIAVSDFGVGIPANIKKNFGGNFSDAEAIVKATERERTTRSEPHNRGMGLDNIITNIVGLNKGKVEIFSYNGYVNCTWNGDRIVKNKEELSKGFCPGTLIDITIRRDTFVPDEIEEVAWSWDL